MKFTQTGGQSQIWVMEVLLFDRLWDLETTKSHVLRKSWTDDEIQELTKTPSLLMINVDFDDFDPRKHPWILFNFGRRMTQGISGVYDLGDILAQLAQIVVEGDSDVFAAAHRIWNRVNPEDAVKVFELKPGIFGFSIDLIQAGRFLRELYMHLVYRGGSA